MKGPAEYVRQDCIIHLDDFLRAEDQSSTIFIKQTVFLQLLERISYFVCFDCYISASSQIAQKHHSLHSRSRSQPSAGITDCSPTCVPWYDFADEETPFAEEETEA